MPLYSCRAGTSWTIVKADNADNARQMLGERLGYEHKPWLWRAIEVRRATVDDIERYGALADSTRPAPKPGKHGRPREKTANKLSLLEGQRSFADPPEIVA